MTAIDELLERNAALVDRTRGDRSSASPSMHIAVLTCMDARIRVFELFGLQQGEAHVLRNAGGVVTDDVIRSLALSQRKLGTREILLVQHTSCGLSMTTEDEFKDELEADTGLRPDLGRRGVPRGQGQRADVTGPAAAQRVPAVPGQHPRLRLRRAQRRPA